MFEGLEKRFLESSVQDERWFRRGLFLASADDSVILPSLQAFDSKLARIEWDLLGRKDYPHSFRNRFLLRRKLGGFRLLWAARNSYDLVAICWPEDPAHRDLRLYCWLAVLVMQPRMFFIFTEQGDGFWLSAENADLVRQHFHEYAKLWDLFSVGRKNIFYRAFRTTVSALLNTFRLAAGTVLFLGAAFLLLFFRMFYDTYDYRYRFFGKLLATPRATRRTPLRGSATPNSASADDYLPSARC